MTRPVRPGFLGHIKAPPGERRYPYLHRLEREGHMKILIVYATTDGQTEKIARFLAEHLRKQHEVELLDATRPGPGVALADFEAIVVGAPVRMAKYPLAILDFVRAHRAQLEQKRAAFFSVCMAAASTRESTRHEAEAYPARLLAPTGWQPSRTAVFAGALRYSRYNWLMRWMMKRIAKSEGTSTDTSRDHEYTDWDAVKRFADSVVAQE